MMRSHICDANEDYFNFLESDIYEAGVDVITTAALLGHADTRVTQEVYTDLRAKHKAQQLNKLKAFMVENYE